MNYVLNDKIYNNIILDKTKQINLMKYEFIISHDRKFKPEQLIKYYNNYNLDKIDEEKYNNIIKEINKPINYILLISNGDILIFTKGCLTCYRKDFSKKIQLNLNINQVESAFELENNNFIKIIFQDSKRIIIYDYHNLKTLYTLNTPRPINYAIVDTKIMIQNKKKEFKIYDLFLSLENHFLIFQFHNIIMSMISFKDCFIVEFNNGSYNFYSKDLNLINSISTKTYPLNKATKLDENKLITYSKYHGNSICYIIDVQRAYMPR